MRHAETVWNAPRRRIQGQSPSSEIFLSEKGKQEIFVKMADIKTPDLLICSPLLRCKQTVETWFGVSFERIQIPTVIVEDLKEIDVGKFEGLYLDELSGNNKKLWELWKSDPLHFTGFPDGENLKNFQYRILNTFSKICMRYSDNYQKILIICHGGPMRILKCYLENKNFSNLWDTDIFPLDKMELTDKEIKRLKNYS